MTTVLPIGYVTVLEAAEMLLPALYAGVPDLPLRKALREEGMDVRDGLAAIDELWKAVDAGTLRPMAIGGRPRRVVRLDAEFTKQVPTLRSPRGRGFAALRQSNPAYHALASWFGPSPYSVSLAFRETEVRKLARKLMRARRIAERGEDQQKPRGRPSQIAIVQSVISDLVGRGNGIPPWG